MVMLILVLLIAALNPVVDDHREEKIDTQRSSLVIYVGKAGLFSVAGHEHWVDAPIADRVNRMGDTLSVRLVVKAADLTVRPDRALSAKELAEVRGLVRVKNELRISFKVYVGGEPAQFMPDSWR